MKNIRIGTDDFAQIIREDAYYVDKTKMIEEILDKKSEVMLFPRPRRFGKTLTLSMISNFFDVDKKEENADLFKGLYIEESKYYQERGTYPTIFLTFKDLKKGNYELFYEEYIEMMADLYVSKNYVYNILDDSEKEYFDLIKYRKGNVSQYQRAVFNMTEYLERYHHKKTILLIDEYDVPIQDGYLNEYYDNVIPFIREVFSKALKTNDSLLFSVMTGVLRVSKESIFSDLNNVNVCGIFNSEFNEYFGFTEEETKTLLEYYGLELNEDVKNMYDGYIFNEVNMYNPWSITNYARKKIMATFWVNTSGNDLIKKMIFKTSEPNKKAIEGLIEGNSYLFTYNEKLTYKDFDNYNNREILFNLMFSSGYLTIDNTKEQDVRRGYLKIPNNEVKELISDIMAESILSNYTYLTTDIETCINNYDLPGLEAVLNEFLTYTSFMDTKESFYHGYILGLFSEYLINKEYKVRSNRESGMGRYDVMLEKLDRSTGYIFEFKVADNTEDMEEKAKEALSQIKEKEYYLELISDKVRDIKCVSVVFKDKKCIVRSI